LAIFAKLTICNILATLTILPSSSIFQFSIFIFSIFKFQFLSIFLQKKSIHDDYDDFLVESNATV